MIGQNEDHPHVGGAAGASSHPTPDESPNGEENDTVAGGDIEIPLGVPMSEEEFRRLKEEARQPRRTGADDADGQAQEDEERDDGT
jgi:hypothetical protein